MPPDRHGKLIKRMVPGSAWEVVVENAKNRTILSTIKSEWHPTAIGAFWKCRYCRYMLRELHLFSYLAGNSKRWTSTKSPNHRIIVTPAVYTGYVHFLKLAIRALGRNHIVTVRVERPHNALFKLNSGITPVRTTSKMPSERTQTEKVAMQRAEQARVGTAICRIEEGWSLGLRVPLTRSGTENHCAPRRAGQETVLLADRCTDSDGAATRAESFSERRKRHRTWRMRERHVSYGRLRQTEPHCK